MNQELFLRDDIMDFSSRLDSQNYNIKAYRKRNKSQTNKNHKHFLQSTEIITSDIHDDLRFDKSGDNTQRTTQILSAKRLSATAGVRKRSHLHDNQFPGFTKTARTKNNSLLQEPICYQDKKEKTIMNIRGPEVKQAVIGNFSKHEKEYSKGGQLKNKHLENWLNQILLEYCHDQKFDSTIENPALKKYGIDKNSLLSKGIDPENLERIYKSLFVYSMGFNTLLKEIGSKNMNIRKTFWKVYAILLEYCSDGDFDTMIGEIERDKVRKMQIMKQEIERRQEIIQNNEEINQQKNAKIFKELKQLRQENLNLENDKNVLMEDYKEAEQAFNEEVSLRLKFQNKINEIHGVHRELGIKHQKLYDDLQAKNFDNSSLKEKLTRITDQYMSLKTDNEFLKKENHSLKEENDFNYTLMEDMKKKFTSHELLEIEWKHKKQQFAILIREKQKRIEQVKGQLKNVQLMLQMKSKSEEELQKQYKRSLDQNKQLVYSLQKELEQINIYMLEKKDFNDTHSRIYAELEIANRHVAQKQKQIQLINQQIEKIKDESDKKSIQIQTLQHKNHQYDIDMKDLYVKISEMKKIKTIIEEELTESRSREEYYRNFYYEKQKIITNLTQKIEEYQRQIAQFNITKKTSQSKITLLTQKLLTEQESNKKKLDKLKAEIYSLDRENKILKKQIEEKLNEVERATLLYEDTFNKLKDQLFQRNDLQLRYNQSLTVVESQTDHIKKLNIRISQIQEKNEDIVRKLKGVEFILENKERTYQNQTTQHNAAMLQLREQLKLKKMFIHPMKYEDLLSSLHRSNVRLVQLKESIEEQKRKMNIPSLNAKIKHMQSQLFQAQINYSQQLQRKCRQIEIEKEKVRQLEDMIQTKLTKGKQSELENSPKINFKQKERKYLEVIKQKSGKIDELLTEVEKIHDQNNQLITRLNEAESQIQQNNSKLQTFEKELSIFQTEKHALNIQKANIFKEKQKYLAKLSDQESRIMDPEEIGSRGFLGIPSSRDIKSQQKSSRLSNTSRQSESKEKIQPGWRNDFAKKVKNAYNFYKK